MFRQGFFVDKIKDMGYPSKNTWWTFRTWIAKQLDELQAKNKGLQNRLDKTEEALEFYKDPANYKHKGWQGDMDLPNVLKDGGTIAREEVEVV